MSCGWFQQRRAIVDPTRRVTGPIITSIAINNTEQLINLVKTTIYMGKRKKSSRKPAPARKQKEVLGKYGNVKRPKYIVTIPFTDHEFTCLYCHHDRSVTVRIERKDGVAYLVCKVCDQRYEAKVNRKQPIYSLFADLVKTNGCRPDRSG